jgi:phospholipase C
MRLRYVRHLLVALTLVAGCHSESSEPPDLGPPDFGPRSTFTDDEAAAARAACMFGKGTFPGQSLAAKAPIGTEIPIDTVVIIMFENRSFDHLLGNLKNGAEVAPANVANPDAQGNMISRFHLSDLCFDDTNHEWSGSHDEWDNGMNDGFVIANKDGLGDKTGKRAMGYYTEADVPVIYALANDWAIADHYFCSLLGPTFPNRMYLYGASSFGFTSNQLLFNPTPNIMESLNSANVSWHVYSETLPGPAIFLDTYTRNLGDHFEKITQLAGAAQAGTLDHVVFIDPNLRDEGADHDDYHPPGDVQLGDQFLSQTLATLTASPQWPHMAIFITFDEHGGLYDHVAPPPACPPDDIAPMLAPGDPQAKFDRYGFRVPLIVVSPYARRQFVSHVVHDHTSITRFIETRFILGALSGRDANADPLLEMFDFGSSQLTTPSLPSVSVDQQRLAACEAMFPINPDGGIEDGGNGD